MNKLLLGIDIGTGGCKVNLVDIDGNWISSGGCEYVTYHDYPGWSEQNPEDWYEGFKIAFRNALNSKKINPKDIIAISVSASTHNMVLLDENMNVLRKTIMWTDQRSREEANWLNKNYGEEIFTITLQKASPTWSLPQLLWIKKHDGEIYGKIKYLMFVKDYIRYKLTDAWGTDYIDAQGSLLLDYKKNRWSDRICKIASIPTNILPPIYKPTDIAGNITKKVAKELGINDNVPVLFGTSDTAIEAYGAGITDPGQCVVKMATAGTVNIFTNKPYPSSKSLTYSYVIPGLWYACMGTNSAAQSLRWFREVFCDLEEKEAIKKSESIYKIIDDKAKTISAGSEGLIFHPYLMGERSPYWDPFLRASFTGINAYHKKGHFCRSIMEGVAFSLKDCYLEVNRMGLDADEVRFIGGGAKSEIWREILSNILGKKVLVLENDDASFGTAMLAGVGIGEFNSFEEAVRKCVKVKQITRPKIKEMEIYNKTFDIYKKIHDGLEEIYKLLPK